MPHRFYHGKTGRVFNVTRHAVGIIVNKRVRYGFFFNFKIYKIYPNFSYRVIAKRINVRVEHSK
jgi:large subunit ribosomal protein L21e